MQRVPTWWPLPPFTQPYATELQETSNRRRTRGSLEQRRQEPPQGAQPRPWRAGAHAQPLSSAQLLAPAWAVAHQGPLSRRFPRQGYWSGLPFPPPADFPDPGIKLAFPASPVGGIFTAEPPGMPASSLILAHFGLGAPDNKCVLFEVTKFVVLSH